MEENVRNLINLIKQYPDLPIVPMVGYDVVDDDYGTWMGKWGEARIDEYLLIGNNEYVAGTVYFKSDEDIESVLYRYFSEDEYERMTDEEAADKYEKLPWIKAIIVDIDSL